jgi:hypothetical protein
MANGSVMDTTAVNVCKKGCSKPIHLGKCASSKSKTINKQNEEGLDIEVY